MLLRRPGFWGWLLCLALVSQAACGGWLNSEDDFGPASGDAASSRLIPAFNLFTPEQDIELGRMTAREYAEQLRLIEDTRINEYVQGLGERLAAYAGGYEFQYRFSVVASGDINAFALPGGYIFVNAGAILEAESEGELAGVLAHEIAHVVLRHGTNQASKAYLARTGLGAVETLTGGRETRVGKLINSLGNAGADLVFLRFSRAAERQADLEGARLMAAAGYDPGEMAQFFSRLRERGGERPHELLSDHPHPANRVAALERLSRTLAVAPRAERNRSEFSLMKARLIRSLS